MPDLVKVVRKYESDGATALLVSTDLQLADEGPAEVAAKVRTFVDKRRWGLPVLVYSTKSPKLLNERFDLPGPIPVTLAIDKEGRVVDREEGQAGAQRFEAMLLKALGR